MYDDNNVFAKIITGKIPAKKLYEDDHLIAIEDISPAAPIHLLVISKGNYVDLADFTSKASAEEIAHYFRAIPLIAKENGAEEYRIVSNKGSSSGQSIFHFHTHLLSGSTNQEIIDKIL